MAPIITTCTTSGSAIRASSVYIEYTIRFNQRSFITDNPCITALGLIAILVIVWTLVEDVKDVQRERQDAEVFEPYKDVKINYDQLVEKPTASTAS